MEYIMAKHGGGRLSVPASAPNYADYVYWFHWAIGTLQSAVLTPMYISMAGVTEESGNPAAAAMSGRKARALKRLDERLRQSPYLAGDELTAADIYAAFPVSTARLFYPFPLTGYDGILQWLKRCSERPAYKALIEKGEKGEDRGVVPTIMAEAPTPIWNIIQK
ncbi:Glutathione S-transferase [Macrophomina phaseolina MS6]|uniref:Glutathione S-transferase n=1 Tax=Macrophomina phaseolina (strain MS6) TaxID=1126212 RepID=K2R9B3_MACPH|nr:Glutathione S-transferase [Macrophomina phaseolina MS6]